ncbi:MAG TPA: hypothetical protein VJB61_16565 [Actinomycetota bacterium]
MDRRAPPRLPEFVVTDLLGLFSTFGVGDLAGVEGAEDRIVRLSTRSSVVCPLHEFDLRPDACRSCRFLAGEAR